MKNYIAEEYNKKAKQGLLDQIKNYLIGNYDENEIIEITAAMNSAGEGIFKDFDSFLKWLEDYNE